MDIPVSVKKHVKPEDVAGIAKLMAFIGAFLEN